jgi:hypothetical protein
MYPNYANYANYASNSQKSLVSHSFHIRSHFTRKHPTSAIPSARPTAHAPRLAARALELICDDVDQAIAILVSEGHEVDPIAIRDELKRRAGVSDIDGAWEISHAGDNEILLIICGVMA